MSPFTYSGDVHDSEALPVYEYLLKELDSRPLTYVHFVRARSTEFEDQKIVELREF